MIMMRREGGKKPGIQEMIVRIISYQLHLPSTLQGRYNLICLKKAYRRFDGVTDGPYNFSRPLLCKPSTHSLCVFPYNLITADISVSPIIPSSLVRNKCRSDWRERWLRARKAAFWVYSNLSCWRRLESRSHGSCSPNSLLLTPTWILVERTGPCRLDHGALGWTCIWWKILLDSFGITEDLQIFGATQQHSLETHYFFPTAGNDSNVTVIWHGLKVINSPSRRETLRNLLEVGANDVRSGYLQDLIQVNCLWKFVLGGRYFLCITISGRL